MLGYRHLFHAGNHADVLKHAVLAWVLQALLRKEKPFVYIDTHAGAGAYALHDPRARRTGEAEEGIGRWWREARNAPALAPLMEVVAALNPDGELRHYPGSPQIARHFLRPEDRMVLMELHPTDFPELAARFAGMQGVRVEHGDALQRLKAHLPPQERRGVVLIDPSYELKSDYTNIVKLVTDAHRRWATGILLVWYPILSRLEAQRFVERLASAHMPRQLCVEYLPHGDDKDGRNLLGSGMVIVNPPFRLEENLRGLLNLLAGGAATQAKLRWSVPE